MVEIEDFFSGQLSQKQQSVIPKLLRNAYLAAQELSESSPILQVPSALDNKGRLIAWATDLALERAINMGTLACDCNWKYFEKPTGRYLELQFSHSTASVSLVHNPECPPRPVVFRENKRLGSPDLFSSLYPVESGAKAPPHFLLIHGYEIGNPEFAYFGLPSSKSAKAWQWRSDNLMKLMHIVPDTNSDIEDTDVDFDERELLKEEIERWIRDNGKNG